VTQLSDLDGFYAEHRRCGELDGGVEGSVVWLACGCGAAIARRADPRTRRSPSAMLWGGYVIKIRRINFVIVIRTGVRDSYMALNIEGYSK
jgi:hypothetical protein